MVFFICNHCGESLKKQVVGNHSFRCNRAINVSCMDCQKDFKGQAYDAHTVCISEAEKYAAKGYVAKVSKGVKKQENWITTVRSIPERHKGLSPGVMNVFAIIERNDNIPRKMQAFINFFNNSNRGMNKKDVQMAWSLIEKEAKAEKQQTPVQTNGVQKTDTNVPAQNGTIGSEKNDETQKVMAKEEAPVKQKKKKTKQSSEHDEAPVEKKQKKSKNVPANNPEVEEPQPTKQKKRKTKDASGDVHEEEESNPSKQKKRKTKDSSQNGNANGTALLVNETNGTDSKAEEQEQQNGSEQKFNLSKVIREFLTAQNNQMKLSKLKKKVMKRYQQATGEEVDGKFEKKFQKKIANTGFVVENDTVRLVEA